MFGRKKPCNLHVNIKPNQTHILLSDTISGSVEITNSETLVVNVITLRLVGSDCYLPSPIKEEETCEFYEGAKIVLAAPEKGQLKLKAGTRKMEFNFNPLNKLLAPTCACTKGSVKYELFLEMSFPSVGTKAIAKHALIVHVNRAPPRPVELPAGLVITARQSFLTHSPIDYTCTLKDGKCDYRAGEAVQLLLEISNQSRMDVPFVSIELQQEWHFFKSTKKPHVETLMKLAVHEPPLFPVPSKETKASILAFTLPADLCPSLPPNSDAFPTGCKTICNYRIALHTTTSKNDEFDIFVPINILDSYYKPAPVVQHPIVQAAIAQPTHMPQAQIPPQPQQQQFMQPNLYPNLDSNVGMNNMNNNTAIPNSSYVQPVTGKADTQTVSLSAPPTQTFTAPPTQTFTAPPTQTFTAPPTTSATQTFAMPNEQQFTPQQFVQPQQFTPNTESSAYFSNASAPPSTTATTFANSNFNTNNVPSNDNASRLYPSLNNFDMTAQSMQHDPNTPVFKPQPPPY